MALKLLSLMLATMQLMSWAAEPLHLCISKTGSVCVELGDKNCTCCTVADNHVNHTDSCACCGHSDAEEPENHPAAAQANACDCTHIPLMIEQDDSIRTATATVMISWNVPIAWLSTAQKIVPSTISVLVLHWDRRNDPSRHPVALMTTVLRC